MRRDARKVADLWVINALAQPRPTLETYRYAMPGEENMPQSELHVFDRTRSSASKVKDDRFKDQKMGDRDRAAAHQPPARAAAARFPREWLSDAPDKIYFTRLAAICSASTSSSPTPPPASSKTLIEERLEHLHRVQAAAPAQRRQGADLLVRARRLGPLLPLRRRSGKLKNRITAGEFVATGIEGVDEKARVLYFTAGGREKGEDPYFTHLYRVGLDGTRPQAAQSRATRRTACR